MVDARRVTLADVARAAGVSEGTASKALNGRRDVGAATRERVAEVAQQLGFAPNSLARGLSGGRTGTVGILTSDLEGRFVLPILMGAEDAFGAGQLSVLLCDARGDAVRERHHLKTLLARRIDGLIVVGHQNDPRPSLGTDLGVPVVYAYAVSEHPEDRSITLDNHAIGRSVAEHLIGLGRRRLLHITGPADHAAAVERAQGVREVVAASGAELLEPPSFGDWTARWGRGALGAALARVGGEVDGVVCGNDRIAFGVVDALQHRGLDVPRDVSVTGVDDWLPLSVDMRPALTTVDLGLQQLGRAAAETVFAHLEGRVSTPGVQRVAGRLVVRESSVPTW